MAVADDVRRVTDGPVVGSFPFHCPYCYEALQDATRGWVCRHCRSTVGADPWRT